MKTYKDVKMELFDVKIGKQNKGNILLKDKAIVSDPCYGLNTWCQGIVENVLPGKYECFLTTVDEGEFGIRVAAIEVTHKDYVDKDLIYTPEKFEVGVDSGQAGIFDYDYYTKYHTDTNERPHVDDDWYRKVCDLTYQEEKNPYYKRFEFPDLDNLRSEEDIDAEIERYQNSVESLFFIGNTTGNIIDNLGFVSSSGYGDGGYTCETAKENGKVVSLTVTYIWDDDEDEI